MRKKISLVPILAAALAVTHCVNNSEGDAKPSEKNSFQSEPSATEINNGNFWDKAKFFQDADVPREKGDIVPKGNFILKEGETKESYIASSNIPWNFSALSKKASAGSISQTQGPYGKIEVMIGRYSVCPSGSSKFPLDLNRGAGGQYVWLCSYGIDAAGKAIDTRTIDVVARSSSAAPASAEVGFKGIGSSNSDLNQGAGGSYVYGRYSKGYYSDIFDYALRGIEVSYCDNWLDCANLSGANPGWSEDGTDLNDGAGGATLKFRYTRYSF